MVNAEDEFMRPPDIIIWVPLILYGGNGHYKRRPSRGCHLKSNKYGMCTSNFVASFKTTSVEWLGLEHAKLKAREIKMCKN